MRRLRWLHPWRSWVCAAPARGTGAPRPRGYCFLSLGHCPGHQQEEAAAHLGHPHPDTFSNNFLKICLNMLVWKLAPESQVAMALLILENIRRQDGILMKLFKMWSECSRTRKHSLTLLGTEMVYIEDNLSTGSALNSPTSKELVDVEKALLVDSSGYSCWEPQESMWTPWAYWRNCMTVTCLRFLTHGCLVMEMKRCHSKMTPVC